MSRFNACEKRERDYVCVFARNLSICVFVFVCLPDWWSVVWVFVWDAGRGLTAVCVAWRSVGSHSKPHTTHAQRQTWRQRQDTTSASSLS